MPLPINVRAVVGVFFLLLVACRPQQTLSPTLPLPATSRPVATLPPPVMVMPTVPAGASPSPSPTTAPLNPAVGQAPYAASDCSDKYPCNEDVAGWEGRMRVPAGFTATYFARVEGSPTTITFGPDGLLYVAVQEGSIFTVDSQGVASIYLAGFIAPAGMAFRPDSNQLYLSSRVVDLNSGGEAQISVLENGQVRQLIGGIPCCYVGMHAANGIVFGPDGYGYLAVGARADHGEILGTEVQDELHPWEASILRFSPDGQEISVYARGLRNAYDLAFDGNGQLFAGDNGPDYGPPDEFHLLLPGRDHGYPWYECDHCFMAPAGVNLVPPLHQFLPHVAPTGLTAYLAHQFPGYSNNLFITLWSAFEGAQKVVRFGPNGEGMTDFATGFAAPIDLTVGPDGSLYVADWATGIIFKISYRGN